jgi:hypothetical protein
MIVDAYPYSLIVAAHVTLVDGEVLHSAVADINAKCYGIYCYSGKLSVIESAGSDAGKVYTPIGSFEPYTANTPNKAQANGDTSWMCVSQRDDTRREVRGQSVNGSFTLPAGWAFLVVEGSVQADGKTADQFRFFKARDTDIEVTGTGYILLVQ